MTIKTTLFLMNVIRLFKNFRLLKNLPLRASCIRPIKTTAEMTRSNPTKVFVMARSIAISDNLR
jgi:hypothetical protein